MRPLLFRLLPDGRTEAITGSQDEIIREAEKEFDDNTVRSTHWESPHGIIALSTIFLVVMHPNGDLFESMVFSIDGENRCAGDKSLRYRTYDEAVGFHGLAAQEISRAISKRLDGKDELDALLSAASDCLSRLETAR